ncbi:unnamed protein product [Schistocephalus solidus]|uniref:Hrs_helical domain-containing protein n=1 Tax=Schistocephalus solidus TaxID=70667 RepID=A0A183TEA6_SCHSO|nr:unnamed protein product [Schistocephalus solidus]
MFVRSCLVFLEQLQDQTMQLREAREALDALRNEHAEARRREEEEAQRLRQFQMMQKVEALRQQKQAASSLFLAQNTKVSSIVCHFEHLAECCGRAPRQDEASAFEAHSQPTVACRVSKSPVLFFMLRPLPTFCLPLPPLSLCVQQAIENQRRLALEQTLQYQQQYQYQQYNAYGLDPATGLPLQPGMMPGATAYGGQPGVEYGYGGPYQQPPPLSSAGGAPDQQAMGPYMYSVSPAAPPSNLENAAHGVVVGPPTQPEANSQQQQQQPPPTYLPPGATAAAATNDTSAAYDMKSVAQALPPPQQQSYPNQSTTPTYMLRMPTPPVDDPQATMKKSPADAQLIVFD